jgi:membrane protease YdiL (CAAX protease family)
MDFIKQGFLGKSDWWRYLVGTLIIFVVWQIAGAIPLMVVAFQSSDNLAELLASAKKGFTTLGIDKNYLLALMLITGVFGVLAIAFVVKKLHHRSFKSVLTARTKFDWKRVFLGFIITAFVALISLYLAVQEGSEELVWNFKPTQFYTLVLVSFALFPFQTGTEEFFFRGYLMQWLGTGLNSRLAALLMTAIAFGLMHGANPEVDKLGPLVMIFYIGTGLFYGVTTLMDEGLELSFGMHTANNIMAALLISTDWTIIHTDALYIDYSEPEVVSIGFLMPVLVGYPLIVLLLAKIYKWTNWKEKLTGSVSNYTNDFDELGN